MTKLARVIFSQRLISLWLTIFLIFITPLFTSTVSAGFEDLNKPIPEENQITDSKELFTIVEQQSKINNETIEQGNNIPPSVTFGDLLSNIASSSGEEISPVIIGDENQIAEKTAQLKALIRDLEATYTAQLIEFKTNSQNSTANHQLPTTNLISPTPFIPIPTLIAQVSEMALINPQFYNNPPPTIFPTPTLTDHLLLASLNHPVAETQTSDLTSPTSIRLPVNNQPKTHYTIALLGDSMTDTLGRDLPHLRNLLKENYPNYSFALLNYGQGATDLESGLRRLTDSSNYLGTQYPPLLTYKPDILVVESFAYNHWSGQLHDLDRQWLTIAKIIDTVRENSPQTKIVLAASIAPNKDIFGDGALNWNRNLKEQATLIIKAYLQNMVNFATSEHYPLVDAYHPTLDATGNGQPQYINSYDHLHPSGEGAYLYSQKILETIKQNSLIN